MKTPFMNVCAVVALAACATDVTAPTTIPLDTDFTLRSGQRLEVAAAAMHVTFEQVVSDNRCPVDEVCITLGNAEVTVMVEPAHGPDYQVHLNTTDDPRTALVTGYFVELRDLTPHPLSGRTIPAADYRLTLRVRPALD